MVADEAAADRAGEPQNAQLRNFQTAGVGVEAANGDGEAALHRRGQADQGQAHVRPPRLQVPATEEAEEPEGAGLPLHHALPLRLNGSSQSRYISSLTMPLTNKNYCRNVIKYEKKHF